MAIKVQMFLKKKELFETLKNTNFF